MKSIVVKNENGTKVYMSGVRAKTNTDREWEKIEETDDEKLQSCYSSLTEDVKREAFEDTMITLITNYLKWDKGNFKHLKIMIDSKLGIAK